MMRRERYWVVEGICQVCMGDRYEHVIFSSDGPLWCEADEILELGLQLKGD